MAEAPPYTPAERRTRETFRALLDALARPGTQHALPLDGPPLLLIAETLLDLETTFFCGDPTLQSQLFEFGARPAPAEKADYLFFPAPSAGDSAAVSAANPGDMLYPDRSATLILAAEFAGGPPLRLTGPGIDGESKIRLTIGLPGFWDLRNAQRRYPLGWDVFFVDGARVVGLPRSTSVVPV